MNLDFTGVNESGALPVGAINHPLLGMGMVTGVRELGHIPDTQVAQTVNLMCARVEEDAADPQFQAHVKRVLGNGTGDIPARVWAQAKKAISFIRDEALATGTLPDSSTVVEFIVRPREMAKLVDEGRAAGDCDDFSMYVAAMLVACGVECSFVTVGADGEAPDQYSHVYVLAYPDGRGQAPVALDASHGEYPGWEVPNRYGKYREWPVNDSGWVPQVLDIAVVAAIVGSAWWLFTKGWGG